MSAKDIPVRLINQADAARYCGVSVTTFVRICCVAPVRLCSRNHRLQRYDVFDLDNWIESKKSGNDNQVEVDVRERIALLGGERS